MSGSDKKRNQIVRRQYQETVEKAVDTEYNAVLENLYKREAGFIRQRNFQLTFNAIVTVAAITGWILAITSWVAWWQKGVR